MKLPVSLFAFLSFALLALTGCDPNLIYGRPGGYGGFGGGVEGVVLSNDTRTNEMEIQTDNGRRLLVTYDSRTRFTYRDQDYSVASIGAGDYVSLSTRDEGRGRAYADLIVVRERRGGLTTDRPGEYGRFGRGVGGVVVSNNTRTNEMEIQTDNGRRLFVTYDSRTRFTYRDQDYSVTSIGVGDYVSLSTRDEGRGRAYADLIVVRERAADRRR